MDCIFYFIVSVREGEGTQARLKQGLQVLMENKGYCPF